MLMNANECMKRRWVLLQRPESRQMQQQTDSHSMYLWSTLWNAASEPHWCLCWFFFGSGWWWGWCGDDSNSSCSLHWFFSHCCSKESFKSIAAGILLVPISLLNFPKHHSLLWMSIWRIYFEPDKTAFLCLICFVLHAKSYKLLWLLHHLPEWFECCFQNLWCFLFICCCLADQRSWSWNL